MKKWIKVISFLILQVFIITTFASEKTHHSTQLTIEKIKRKIESIYETINSNDDSWLQHDRIEYYQELEIALDRYLDNKSLDSAQKSKLVSEGLIPRPAGELDELGGPDDFGYTYIDSQEEGGPVFNWIDISATGDTIPNLWGDHTRGPFEIGFEFPFYGETHSEFYLCSHGWLSFTSTQVVFDNSVLPDSDPPNNTIAFYWDDFCPDPYDIAYYETIGDLFIVQIDNDSTECQVQLSETGMIQMMYNSGFTGFHGFAAGETIGIENEDGSIGLTVSFVNNPPNYPFEELAIRFTTTAYNLSGNIENIEGDPLEDACVYLAGAPAFYAHSDEIGHYSLDVYDINNQPFTIICQADGYEQAEVEGVEWEDEFDDQIVNFVLTEIDPRIPPTIGSWNGYCDHAVILEMEVPGAYENLFDGNSDQDINELDDFLGFNAFYSLDNGETWSQHNDELIEDVIYELSLGSDFENTEFLVYITAIVDSAGIEIESDPSLTHEVMFNMPPAAPSNLQVIDIDSLNLTVTITWIPCTENEDGSELVDLAEYRIYRNGEFLTIVTPDQEPFVDEVVPSPGFYTYTINARDEVPNITTDVTTDFYRIGNPTFFTSFEPDAQPEQPNPFDHNGMTWEWGSPLFGPEGGYGGTDYCWATILNAYYLNDQLDELESTRSWAVMGNPFIVYYHWFMFGWIFEGDGYNLKISDDNRETWTIVEPVGGYDYFLAGLNGEPGFGGMGAVWEEVRFDLSEYSDSDSIHIKFCFGSDHWLCEYGVAIDHLEIWGVQNEDHGYIEGFVYNHEDQPMEGARVFIEEYPQYDSFVDANGYYFILNAPAGIFNIICENTDYWPQTVLDFVIPIDDTVTCDFTNDSGYPMLFPDGELETTSLEVSINIHPETGDSTGQEDFILESVGSGQLEWDAYVRVYDNPELVSNDTELDQLWDHITSIDIETPTENPCLTGAVVTEDSIYITGQYRGNGLGENAIYSFDHNGILFNTYPYPNELLDEEEVSFYDIAYNPEENILYGANSEGDLYQFEPDFATYSHITTLNFGPNALAYDINNNLLYVRDWNSYFSVVDLSSGMTQILDLEPQERYVSGLAYMPIDPDGYNIWLIAHDTDHPTQGGYVFKYNPVTSSYDMNTIEIYPAGGFSSSAGMDISIGWQPGYWHIATVYNTVTDRIDIWEGIYSQPDWIWIGPSGGVIEASETSVITLNADLSIAEDIPDIVEGMELYADIVFNGECWINPPVMDLTILIVDEEDNVGESELMPTRYSLHQNYPNPFNPMTMIKFDLVQAQNVKLSVFNVLGQEVAKLANERFDAGYHQVAFVAEDLASGIYFYRIETPAFTNMKKMVLVK